MNAPIARFSAHECFTFHAIVLSVRKFALTTTPSFASTLLRPAIVLGPAGDLRESLHRLRRLSSEAGERQRQCHLPGNRRIFVVDSRCLEAVELDPGGESSFDRALDDVERVRADVGARHRVARRHRRLLRRGSGRWNVNRRGFDRSRRRRREDRLRLRLRRRPLWRRDRIRPRIGLRRRSLRRRDQIRPHSRRRRRKDPPLAPAPAPLDLPRSPAPRSLRARRPPPPRRSRRTPRPPRDASSKTSPPSSSSPRRARARPRRRRKIRRPRRIPTRSNHPTRPRRKRSRTRDSPARAENLGDGRARHVGGGRRVDADAPALTRRAVAQVRPNGADALPRNARSLGSLRTSTLRCRRTSPRRTRSLRT